jgi:SAM-dependent methyltransferase
MLRRIMLLELSPARFADRALTAFALALLAQGWNNDHAWAESKQEADALASIELDRGALAAGDLNAARDFMLLSLYRPISGLMGTNVRACDVHGIRPRPLRELIELRLAADMEERELAGGLPQLGDVEDAVSRRVAGQYEQSPYPRWQSLRVPAAGSLRAALTRYIRPERLQFMEEPFDVLIAGAGTGRHALQSTIGYGGNARVLAIDLSRPSLGYAERQRRQLGIGGVEFMVADILELDRLDRRFDIIECIGVLHHMADPWAGWQVLLRQLKPHGLMYIGLYSAVSRHNIAELRADPAYPGAGCSLEAARRFRATLLDRPETASGRDISKSKNFWNLSEFRDLALHECEHHVALQEIERFLARNGLVFRGFTLGPEVLQEFARRYPGNPWPGSLAEWQRYEADNPRTFDAMYRFWCERAELG